MIFSCSCFKYSSYFSVQNNVKITYYKKEWQYLKLVQNLQFNFLIILNPWYDAIHNYIILKTETCKIKNKLINQSSLLNYNVPTLNYEIIAQSKLMSISFVECGKSGSSNWKKNLSKVLPSRISIWTINHIFYYKLQLHWMI